MWVEELKTGKLRAVERYTDPLTEKYKKVSITIPDRKRKTLKEAEKILEQKIKDATTSRGDRVTFGELVKLHLADCEKRLKPSTYSRRKVTATNLVKHLGADSYIDKIAPIHIARYLTTRWQVKEFITIMRWAYRMDYIESIAFLDKLAIPERDKTPKKKYLEPEELTDILSRIRKDDYRDLTEFLALTGMRVGEALAITIDDIDLSERLISVNKTFYGKTMILNDTPKTPASNRKIYIQDDLLPLVRKLYKITREVSMFNGCRFIFQREGKALNYNGYRDAVRLLGIHPHMLRHTHTALMAAQGVPLDVISRRLGHENSKVTREIYFHVTEKQRQKDYEAVRQVSLF